jgi:multiple sugar transport system permease protein
MFSVPVWSGLENYKAILFDVESTFHRQFLNGFKNTFLFVIMMVPLQIIVPLLISIALFSRPKGERVFQSIFYIPTLFSISATALTWKLILQPGYGLLNNGILHTHINWFAEQPNAWISILIVTTWWVIGGNMLIYIASLNGIDAEILEYARLDGVSGIRRLFSIYLPLIRLPLLFTVVGSITAQFNIYGQPVLLTGGGPTQSTYVLIMYIRDLAFGTGNSIAGIASAMAMIMGLCIGILAVLQMRLIMKLSAD